MHSNLQNQLRVALFRIIYAGNQRYCPLCNSKVRKFLYQGAQRRLDARCPVCNSLERHRQVGLWLRQEQILKPDARILHVAPETQLASLFRRASRHYVSTDLFMKQVSLRADLMSLPLETASIDFIYCSHVLEHVPDDRAAMREMRRLLSADGIALINVPVNGALTDEDPTISDPAERARRFGQDDHVRIYGTDVEQRLAEAGFLVQIVRSVDVALPEQHRYLGLRDDILYVCRPDRA
jgi:SAM-dependent methyltransferase